MSPHVVPPGEPNLVTALLAAAKFNGAGYVNRYDGVAGWHVSSGIPRGVAAYYRVFAGRVYVRDASGNEYLVGEVVGQTIIQKGPGGKGA